MEKWYNWLDRAGDLLQQKIIPWVFVIMLTLGTTGFIFESTIAMYIFIALGIITIVVSLIFLFTIIVTTVIMIAQWSAREIKIEMEKRK